MQLMRVYRVCFLKLKVNIQSHSVITDSSGPAIFVRYNRVILCSQMTTLPLKSVRYNREFGNNRVRYNRVSQYSIKLLREREWKLKRRERHSFRLFFEVLTLPQMSKSKHPNNSKILSKAFSNFQTKNATKRHKSKQLLMFSSVNENQILQKNRIKQFQFIDNKIIFF